MCEKKKNIYKTYSLVAPDGGWGYMICIAVTINLITTTAFTGCFGMLYNDFLKEIDMKSTEVTLLAGVNAFAFAITGLLASPLQKILSLRKLSFISVIMYDLGVLGTVFVKSKFLFFICYGVLQGAGLGLCFNTSFTKLNEYFLKRRLLANSIVQSVVGVFTIFVPTIVSWSLNTYGYRGTLLFIAGISLQNLIASALMQPVEWHMKRIETEEKEEKQLMLVEDPTNEASDTPIVKSIDLEGKGSDIKEFEYPPESEKSKGLRKFLENFIDLSLCKTFVISCTCIGTALINFSDSTGTVILPQSLYAAEWDQESVAWALSSLLFGDLAIRVAVTFLSKWLIIIGNLNIYLAGIWLGFIARLGMLWSINHIAIIIYIGLMGVSRGIFVVLVNIVIADAVSPEQFTSALGLTLFISGNMILIMAPAIGKIRDSTNSYSTAFYILTCIYAIVLLFWSIEILYKKNEHKRRAREESLKKINKSKKFNKGK